MSPVQRLILSAFRFNVVKSKEIFLHCLVKACLRSDQSSRCAKGCPFGKRKKRESENEIARFLALGPIIVSSNRPSEITGMVSVMILARECEQSPILSFRSSLDAPLEARGFADRYCSLVCVLPSRIFKQSTTRRLLLQFSSLRVRFTLIFLVCLSYYLAESLTPKEDTTVVGVVAGLLGVVAVLLVAALVAVIYKRRKKPDVTGAVTLPLVCDNVPGPG